MGYLVVPWKAPAETGGSQRLRMASERGEGAKDEAEEGADGDEGETGVTLEDG